MFRRTTQTVLRRVAESLPVEWVIVMPAVVMTTSSLGPGSEGAELQLFGLDQSSPSELVQKTVAGSVRSSSSSSASFRREPWRPRSIGHGRAGFSQRSNSRDQF